MSSVLLGMRRLDPLRPDAQLHPPDRQARQASDGAGGEGRAVVGADRLRHPVLAEGSLEDGLHPQRVRLFHRLAAQQVTRAGVADGQRIDALSGSMRSPSRVRLQPLKSPHQTRLGAAAAANGAV